MMVCIQFTSREKIFLNKPAPRRRNKPRHNFNVTGKTRGQKEYIQSIRDNELTLCSGFAGTGKTVCAVGMALKLYHEKVYSKIIIVRPALEACKERIGYLPGDINDKMRPLIQPIIDNMRVFIKDEGYLASLLPGSNILSPIEIRTLSFMRGTTWNNCVIIFDEAQNSTPEQMKLFLTRIGKNCKVIVEGDVTQSDVSPKYEENGLYDAIGRLRDLEGIGIVTLEKRDIVRSSIVARILDRY